MGWCQSIAEGVTAASYKIRHVPAGCRMCMVCFPRRVCRCPVGSMGVAPHKWSVGDRCEQIALQLPLAHFETELCTKAIRLRAAPAVDDGLNGGVLASQTTCISGQARLTVIQHSWLQGWQPFRALRASPRQKFR